MYEKEGDKIKIFAEDQPGRNRQGPMGKEENEWICEGQQQYEIIMA